MGSVNINGNHYEFRVVGNNDSADGVYVNYIYDDTLDKENLAYEVLKNMVQGLEK